MQNFAYPYFSRDITEFWKRWHISLTTWFRDYVFLPLSFALASGVKNEKIWIFRKDHFVYILASLVTWLLTGLWHGSDYTFIVWGLLNGALLIMYHLQSKPRKKMLKRLNIRNNNTILVILESGLTLFLILLAWIFFRSESVKDSFQFINGVFSASLFTLPEVRPKVTILLTAIYFGIEWTGREDLYPIASRLRFSRPLRWTFYYGIVLAVLSFCRGSARFYLFSVLVIFSIRVTFKKLIVSVKAAFLNNYRILSGNRRLKVYRDGSRKSYIRTIYEHYIWLFGKGLTIPCIMHSD